MQTGIQLSLDTQELLKNSQIPTTVAAEATPPAIEVVEEIKQDAPSAPQEQQQSNPKQPMTDEQLEFVADIIVTTFDTVQEFGFTFLSNRKLRRKAKDIAGDGAMQRLSTMLREQDKATRNKTNEKFSYDSEESELLDLYDTVKRFQEDLPFDQRAADNIKFSIKNMLREKQQQLSPQMLLMISLLGALTPNIAALKTI